MTTSRPNLHYSTQLGNFTTSSFDYEKENKWYKNISLSRLRDVCRWEILKERLAFKNYYETKDYASLFQDSVLLMRH